MLLVLSVLCLAIIVLHCAALTQILNANALPRSVKSFWVGAVLLLPVIAAALWFRLPMAAKLDPVANRPGRSYGDSRGAVTMMRRDQ